MVKRGAGGKAHKKLREGTNFDDTFIEELRAAASAGADGSDDDPCAALAGALLTLAAAPTAVAELEALKRVLAAADLSLRPAGDKPNNAADEGGGGGGDATGAATAATTGVGAQATVALSWLARLLAQDDARPLHRNVLSYLRRLPGPRAAAAARAAVATELERAARAQLRLLQDAATAAAEEVEDDCAAAADVPSWTRPALSVVQAAAAVASLPAACEWLPARAAGPLLELAARGCGALLAASERGAVPAVAAVEQLHEAITATAFMLAHHGRALCAAAAKGEDQQASGASGGGGGGGEPQPAPLAAGKMLLAALRSCAVTREAVAGAAVGAWHAALLPDVPPAAAAVAFARGLGLGSGGGSGGGGDDAATAAAAGAVPLPALSPSAAFEAAWRERSALERSLAADFDAQRGPGAAAAAVAAHGSCFAAMLAQVPPAGRLAALRGLVGALPVAAICSDLSSSAHSSSGSSGSEGPAGWALLMDGAVPAATAALVAAGDSHSKHLAAAALAAALQRARSVWSQLAAGSGGEAAQIGSGTDINNSSSGGEPSTTTTLLLPWLPPRARDATMAALWPLLDDGVPSTLRQVQEAFERLLALVAAQAQHGPQLAGGGAPPTGCAAADADAFARATAAAVLRLPPGRKGRYAPLAALLPRVGARWMLAREPRLAAQVLMALSNDMVAAAAGGFLRVLLVTPRAEHAANGGGSGNGDAGGDGDSGAAWHAAFLPAVAAALSGGDERLRTYVASHGLPILLRAEPGLLQPLLRALAAVARDDASGSGGREGRMAGLVLTLRTARQLSLLGDLADADAALRASSGGTSGDSSSSGNIEMASASGALLECASARSGALRLAALELACSHPRATEPPGALELRAARAWLKLNALADEAWARTKALTMLGKLLARTRTSAYAVRTKLAATAARPAQPQPLPRAGGGGGKKGDEGRARALAALRRVRGFTRWLCRYALGGLYPGAPLALKAFALDVLRMLLETWGDVAWPAAAVAAAAAAASGDQNGTDDDDDGEAALTGPLYQPFDAALLSPGATTTLVGCLFDSHDALRAAAAAALALLPAPLPGLAAPAALQPLAVWAADLLASPRLRDADAGARIVRLIADDYALALGWRVRLWPSVVLEPPALLAAAASTAAPQPPAMFGPEPPPVAAALAPRLHPQGAEAVAFLLQSLAERARAQLDVAARDLPAAAAAGLAHGPLLAARYVAEGVPWAAALARPPALPNGGAAAAGDAPLREAVAELFDVCAAAMAVAVPPLSDQTRNVAAVDVAEEAAEAATAGDDGGNGLDDSDSDDGGSDNDDDDDECSDADGGGDDGDGGDDDDGALGPTTQLVGTACWTTIKEASVLPAALACGAPLLPDSTAAAAAAAGGLAPLLTTEQLEAAGGGMLAALLALKHNGAVDKVRAPFARLAGRLLRDAGGGPLRALPGQWMDAAFEHMLRPGQSLDDIVRRSAGLPYALVALFLAEPRGAPRSLLPRGAARLLAIAGDRALDPWPRVHAFNALALLYNESALALDASAFLSAGALAAVEAAADASWAVRNAASLALTALTVRLAGFKNAGLAGGAARHSWATWGPTALRHSARAAAAAAAAAVDGDGAAAAGNASSSGSATGEGEHGAAVVASLAYAKAPTAAELFERQPPLHAYALKQLREAAAATAAAETSGASAAAAAAAAAAAVGDAHPRAFRVMLLLARLRPSVLFLRGGAGAGDGGPLAPGLLAPPLLQVARSPVYSVRKLAARALAPLVPPERRVRAAGEVAAAALAAAAAAGDGRIAAGQHNALHGALLQAEALLSAELGSGGAAGSGGGSDNAAAGNGDDGSTNNGGEEGCGAAAASAAAAAAAAAAEVADLLADAAWLAAAPAASPRGLCPPIAAAYLRAAGAALRLAVLHGCLQRNDGTEARDGGRAAAAAAAVRLAAALEACCRGAVAASVPDATAAAPAPARSDALPQRAWWLKQAATLLTGPLLEASLLARTLGSDGSTGSGGSFWAEYARELAARVRACLPSGEAEVRAAAYKAAARQLPGARAPLTAPGAAAAAAELAKLEDDLWRALAVEPNAKVRRRLLALAAGLQRLQPAADDGGVSPAAAPPDLAMPLRRAQQARAALDGAKDAASRAHALECLGRAARPLVAAAAAGSSTGEDADALAAAIDGFAATVKAFGGAAPFDALRLAAARALHSSGLLAVVPLGGAAAASGPNNGSGPAALRLARASLVAWPAALALLQDDDGAVRATAAAAVQDACGGGGSGGGGGAAQQALCEAAVLRLAFGALAERAAAAAAGSAAAASSPAEAELAAAALRVLCEAVFDPATPVPPTVRALAGGARARRQRRRRLFDKEDAGGRSCDALAAARAAAAALARAFAAAGPQAPPPPHGFAEEWAAAAARWLARFAEAASAEGGAHAAAAWPGGLACHPEVYAPLARCLEALRCARRLGLGLGGGGDNDAAAATAALLACGALPSALAKVAADESEAPGLIGSDDGDDDGDGAC